MPTRQRARGRRTRRAPPRDALGRLDIAPPRTDVAVRLDLPPDLHELLVWAARRYETTVEGYLFGLVQDDLVEEVERWERDHAGSGRRRA
jgi:hypothetical protein